MSKPSPPAPLTPSDCDLQDFPFMPLHVARLRDSDLASEAHPEACWYAVLLWAASWHQIPAASLPDNDAVMTKLIGLGRDVRTFRKHRQEALHRFILCSDGRLYHSIVAEQANIAWHGKLQQRWRTECARIKKANQRNETDYPTPTWEEFVRSLPPGSRPLGVPEDTSDRPQGQNGPSPETDPQCPQGNDVQEKETGTGTGRFIDVAEDVHEPTSTLPAIIVQSDGPAVADDWPSDRVMETLVETVASPRLDPAKSPKLVQTSGRLAAWKRAGASWEFDVVPVVASLCAKSRTPVQSWDYFRDAVLQSIADNREALKLPDASSRRPSPQRGPGSWSAMDIALAGLEPIGDDA